MKKIFLLAVLASAMFSATYEVREVPAKCKVGFEEKQVQTNKTYYSYQVKRYKTVCVEIKEEKVK